MEAMALQIKIPVIKRFDLVGVEEDGVIVLKKAEPPQVPEGYISFRQATTADVEQRTAVLSKRTYANDEDDRPVIVNETNHDYLARTEVALTLAGTDLQLSDGSMLEFENGRIKDRAKFDKMWSAMDPNWAIFIHQLCLEVNPLWDFSKRIV